MKLSEINKKEWLRIILLIIIFIGAIIYFLHPTLFVEPGLSYNAPTHDYPRIANLYWKAPITTATAEELSKWDLLVLDLSAQNESAEAIRYLRKLNPNIIILAYASATEVPKERLSIREPKGVGVWCDLTSGIKSQWQLKTCQGQDISWWPGNTSLNLCAKDENNRTYADYLSQFLNDKVLSTGLWDGIIFDTTWDEIAWKNNNIDIDGDGRKDSVEKINSMWRSCHNNFFDQLRKKAGSKYLLLSNGNGSYSSKLNGRMFEGFPEISEGAWVGSVQKYAQTNSNGLSPRINIINSDTNNTGNSKNYQAMRLGLGSALLYNGYFSFDYGTQLREQLWYYDEYDANLGQPKSQPFNLLDQNNSTIKEGLWQRDFANGLVIVNATSKKQSVKFDSEYEKIHGTQDTIINDGSIVDSLSLNPWDSIILLRPINQIDNQVFVNGSFVRVFNKSGVNTRTGFFAYNSKFRGGTKIISTDIDNDGKIETVSAGDSSVSTFNSAGVLLRTVYPYGDKYKGGISLTVADVSGGNSKEIITAPENGSYNQIKIYDNYGILMKTFSAYQSKNKTLGARVATGDINGDGKAEIITGAGNKGGPHVKIFSADGKMISEFFSYGFKFRGGTYVASGDINGDGIAEIITGMGSGGEPLIKTFDSQGHKLGEWLAYKTSNREGSQVLVSDIDHDGLDEIVAMTTDVFTTSFYKNPNK